MPRKTKDIISGLTKKGFKPRMGDHKYYHYYSRQNKKTTVFTRISHGKREYDDFLLGQIAKQLRVDKKFLFGLIDCPKTQEDYEDHLRKIAALE